jgi:RNA polymerase sigma-70 factor (ECF subfamily)
MDETALVERAAGGDREAFSLLYDRHAPFAYNVALRLMNDPDEAEDLAQEVFVTAWRTLPGFRGGSAFRTWLYRIVVNRGINRIKARRPASEMPDELMVQRSDPARFMVDDPARGMEIAQAETLLNRLLARLDPDRKVAVVLREIEGLSYDEIAAITGAPVGTVRSRIARGRKDLAALAEEMERTDGT